MAPRNPRFPGGNKGAGGGFNMEENLRIAIQLKIDAFIDDPAETRLDFPASLTSGQRGYVHNYVRLKGLKSRSYGNGADRFLSLSKRTGNTVIEANATIRLSTATRQLCQSLLDGPHRMQPHDSAQLARFSRNSASTRSGGGATFRCSLGNQFKFAVPPPRKQQSALEAGRRDLPIFAYREHILATLAGNQVLVVSGDTGSGKTTQVPQYMLEEAHATGQACRIICTQPRRLAAISIADRVAHERGEQLGHTVGYQIRLESRISQTSNLIYTTSGFLLRCLISGTQHELFTSLTHIILDEVHERDKFTDFLLIAIRDALAQYPRLKIVLMSATIDSDVFTRYFGGCPIVDIPGRMFPVQLYNLEQTLGQIGYTHDKVEHFRRQHEAGITAGTVAGAAAAVAVAPTASQNRASVAAQRHRLDKEIQDYVDEVLEECFCSHNEDCFAQFLYLVTGESVPVDTQHSQTQMSALMSAASKGFLDSCEKLIGMGADPLLAGPFGIDSVMWARMNKRDNCVAYLSHIVQQSSSADSDAAATVAASPTADQRQFAHNQILLRAYQFNQHGDELDYALMFAVVRHIHRTQPAGAILVFLPGYDSIVEMNDALQQYAGDALDQQLTVFMLHGSMQAADQKRVFGAPAPGCRKVILATNIAETSLTIDDVVYVIDSGLVKQKSFDALTGATALTATSISQACAKQRMGRAGRCRPGVCFRLYSQLRFDSMEPFTLPEILRVPLTEIALSARIMSGEGSSIGEFLARAIQAPPAASVAQSIALLQRLGALDEAERCTELGRLLVDIPVDVQLGKALLYAVVLRCLDPVLTIVSSLSVKDPFVLPMGGDSGGGESHAKTLRRQLADGSCSDHMTLLRVYQQWNESKSAGYERQFCRENYVSSGSLQMICGVRSQILGHLRSIGMIQHRAPGNIHELNKHSDNWPMVKACLTAGLYPNVCRIDRARGQLLSRDVKKLLMHHSSVLRQKNPKRTAEDLRALPSEWILFEEMSWAGISCMVRWNTVVSPVNVALFAGQMHAARTMPVNGDGDDYDDEDDDDHTSVSDDGEQPLQQQPRTAASSAAAHGSSQLSRYVVDDWIAFTMDASEARLLHHLRQRINVAVAKVVQQPHKFCLTQGDQQCIDLLAKVLQQEDRFCGLEVQRDVGRRPIAVKLSMAPDTNFGHGQDRSQRTTTAASSSSGEGKYFTPMRAAKRADGPSAAEGTSGKHPNGGVGGGRGAAGHSGKPAYGLVRSNHAAPTATVAVTPPIRSVAPRDWKVNADTARFFIVHASSELQVQQHFRESSVWCWSNDLLKDLILTNFVSVTRCFSGSRKYLCPY